MTLEKKRRFRRHSPSFLLLLSLLLSSSVVFANISFAGFICQHDRAKLFQQMDYNFTVSTFINSGKDEMALATISQAYKASIAFVCECVCLRFVCVFRHDFIDFFFWCQKALVCIPCPAVIVYGVTVFS